MARAFPPPLEVFDTADRADGPASASAGATIWDDIFIGGGASGLVVTSNELAVTSGDQGAITVDSFTDFGHVVFLSSVAGGGALGYYWRLQNPGTSGWDGYWLVCDSLNWAIRKRRAGGTSVSTLDSVTVGSSISGGVAVRVVGDLMEVYRYEEHAFSQTPILSATDSEFTSGPVCLNLPNTGWRVTRIDQFDETLSEPDGPFTLYVNPDHPDASDSYTRAQASDPDTPLASATRAVNLAFATASWGDTVQIEPATNVDPTNDDPRMYPTLDHRSHTKPSLPFGWPFGDNDGNAAITVRGNIVADQKPIMYGLDANGLKNWVFEDMQFGYDIGSGFEFDTIRVLERSQDLTFRGIDFTGGAHQLFLSYGDMLWEDCYIRHELNPAGVGSDSGRGFVSSYSPLDADGGENSANLTWRGCTFQNIRNDAIQVSMGGRDPDPKWGVFTVEDCLFHNVTEQGEGGNEALHADSIQTTGGPEFNVRRSVFIGCSNMFIASDFGHGTIRLQGNVAVGGGGLVQVQGYDHLIMQHNTLVSYGPDASAGVLFYTRYIGTDLKVTIQNNRVDGIFYRDEAADNHLAGSVYESNLVLNDPGGSIGSFGTHLPGIPEMGTSARLADIPTTALLPVLPDPVPANYELANTPTESPGIGEGVDIVGGIPDDMFGRAWTSPPDVGALQSDPGTSVLPTPRPPYLVSRTPAVGATGVDAFSSVTFKLYPKPGEQIDPATVTTDTVSVADPTGALLPVQSLALTGPNVAGEYTITLDIDGQLYPLVSYTVTATTVIADTEGSHLAAQLSWSFRVAGTSPAVYDGDAPSGWIVGVVG